RRGARPPPAGAWNPCRWKAWAADRADARWTARASRWNGRATVEGQTPAGEARVVVRRSGFGAGRDRRRLARGRLLIQSAAAGPLRLLRADRPIQAERPGRRASLYAGAGSVPGGPPAAGPRRSPRVAQSAGRFHVERRASSRRARRAHEP